MLDLELTLSGRMNFEDVKHRISEISKQFDIFTIKSKSTKM